ncbi:uncharacterized protein [Amphiura filiformis]|uniref:uncharacterized protein n=1 Tax=Amphiura filiformis TaxID=82378 RepID=UPI003B21C11C
MKEWYNQLMKPLRREGWIDNEDIEVDGIRQRSATNPEVLKRPNRTEQPKTHSAYAVLDGGFDSPTSIQDKRKAAVYDEDDYLLLGIPDGAVGGADEGAVGGAAEGAVGGAVGGRPSLPEDGMNISSGLTITRVEGDHNIVINHPRDSELKFQVTCDVSMIAEIVNQVTKAIIPPLTTQLLSKLTSVTSNATRTRTNQHDPNQDQAMLEQDSLLHEVISTIEANGGQAYKVEKGSIVFAIRFETKADLERFWQAYLSGKLARDLSKCLITKELEQKSGQKLAVQLQIQESEYKKGLDLLDSGNAQKESLYVVPSAMKHTYVNVDHVDINDKRKPPVPERKESMSDLSTRLEKPTQIAQSSLCTDIADSYEVPVIQSTSITENIYDQSHPDEHTYKATTDSVLKAKLENVLIFNKGLSTVKIMPPISEDTKNVYDYCDIPADGDSTPMHMTHDEQTLYETVGETDGTSIPKSKSLHISSFEAAQNQWRRQQTVPASSAPPALLKVSNPKEKPSDKPIILPIVTNPSQPQVPWRVGKTLESSIKMFQKQQEEDYVTVYLSPRDAMRLAFVKVDGLMYIWLNHWDSSGCPLEETVHPGDQIQRINGVDMKNFDIAFAKQMMENMKEEKIRFSIRRAPYANVLHIQLSQFSGDLGVDIEGNVITKVYPDGLFRKHLRSKATGVLSPDLVNWAITEINMQPVNQNYSTSQIRYLLDKSVTEVALVIQPSDLIQAMRDALRDCDP